MADRFTHSVLVPGWIATFGLVSLLAPPLDVAASLSALMVGVFVIPALVLIPSAVRPPGAVRATRQPARLDPDYGCRRWVAKRRKACGSVSAQRTR